MLGEAFFVCLIAWDEQIKIAPFITKGQTGIKAAFPVSDGLVKPVKVIILFQNKVSYWESANN